MAWWANSLPAVSNCALSSKPSNPAARTSRAPRRSNPAPSTPTVPSPCRLLRDRQSPDWHSKKIPPPAAQVNANQEIGAPGKPDSSRHGVATLEIASGAPKAHFNSSLRGGGRGRGGWWVGEPRRPRITPESKTKALKARFSISVPPPMRRAFSAPVCWFNCTLGDARSSLCPRLELNDALGVPAKDGQTPRPPLGGSIDKPTGFGGGTGRFTAPAPDCRRERSGAGARAVSRRPGGPPVLESGLMQMNDWLKGHLIVLPSEGEVIPATEIIGGPEAIEIVSSGIRMAVDPVSLKGPPPSCFQLSPLLFQPSSVSPLYAT